MCNVTMSCNQQYHCCVLFFQIFERYLKKEFDDHPFHVDSTPVDSVADEVVLTIPEHSEGFKIQPAIRPPKVIQCLQDTWHTAYSIL